MNRDKLFTMRVDDCFFEELDILRAGKKMSRSAMVRTIIKDRAAPLMEGKRKQAEQQAMIDTRRALAKARPERDRADIDKILFTRTEAEVEAAKREREEGAAIKGRRHAPGAAKETARRLADKYIARGKT